MYELLGLVKDGKAPKKIKYDGTIYEYNERVDFYYWKESSLYREFATNGNCLDKEVEIIEEPKKINKIRIDYNSINIDKAFETGTTTFFREKDIEIFQCLSSKINELIDEINNLKENKYE